MSGMLFAIVALPFLIAATAYAVLRRRKQMAKRRERLARVLKFDKGKWRRKKAA